MSRYTQAKLEGYIVRRSIVGIILACSGIARPKAEVVVLLCPFMHQYVYCTSTVCPVEALLNNNENALLSYWI